MTLYNPALAQLGTSNGSTWTDDDPITVTATNTGAARMGPIVVGRNEVITSAVLNIGTITIASPLVVVYMVVHRPTLGAWATGNLPDPQRRIEVGRASFTSPGSSLAMSLDPTALLTLQRHGPNWNGYFPLVIKATATVFVGINSMDVVTTAAGFAPSLPELRNSRPDFCPKCGRPCFREDWVRDPYTKGRVCDECADPADPGPIPQRPARVLLGED